MKLTKIKDLGRFHNPNTGQRVNLKIGRNSQRGTEHIFYLYRGKRVMVSDKDFYSTPKQWIYEKSEN